jgi:hypothetical protein
VWALLIVALKNSSAAKIAFGPARTRISGIPAAASAIAGATFWISRH